MKKKKMLRVGRFTPRRRPLKPNGHLVGH